jgi:hypothetical protein
MANETFSFNEDHAMKNDTNDAQEQIPRGGPKDDNKISTINVNRFVTGPKWTRKNDDSYEHYN